MNEAAVTLPQLLLLSRIEQLGSASLAAIGDEILRLHSGAEPDD